MPYAPAIVNAGSQLVKQLYNMHMNAQTPVQPPPIVQIAPGQPKKRRRPRRKRNSPKSGPSVGGQEMRVKDVEKWSIVEAKADYKEFPFGTCARLTKFAAMYSRYKIHSVVVKYCPLVGSAQVGAVQYGIMAGKNNAQAIKQIMALKPSQAHHGSIYSSISVGQNIMAQPFLYTGAGGSDDGTAFTLYWTTTVASVGVFEVTYDVTFSSPLPFT